jgi:SAM-dependent methyltransferase
MEHVNCILCNHDDTRDLFRKRDKFGTTGDEFTVVECRNCGLAYVNPRPSQEEMGKFYPETYSWKENIETGSSLVRLLKRFEKGYRYHLLKGEVSKVERHGAKRTGKVLDIGCGAGDRLDVFRSRGFEPAGVETSDAAGYARKHLKLNVLKGDLFAARFPVDSFDVVTLYHVLEHTHDPQKVCEEVHRILRKEGLLVIEVPNRESFQYKLFGGRWAAVDVPRDLYYFGTGTLTSLLTKAGFQILTVDHFMNWWHPPTLVISLFPGLDPQRAWQEEGKGGNPIGQRIAWMVCTLLAGAFTHFESMMKRGAIVTFYARKHSLQG